jgi:hypothetical protein
MTANPLTDQIAANIATHACDLSQYALDDIALFAERMHDTLPGVNDAVIGQVLLHAADLYATFATNNHTTRIGRESLVAVQMLGEAGRRLYTPQNTPTATT